MPNSKNNVVELNGGPFHHPGAPDELVIKDLEWLLERAKAGEVVGLTWAVSYFDGTGTDHFAGVVTRAMVGRLFGLMDRITHHLRG